MRRIATLMQQDLVNSLRDNLVIFTIVGPLLMALALRLILPGVNIGQTTFAVMDSYSPEVQSALSRYGVVEIFSRETDLARRVEAQDDAIGLKGNETAIRVLIEGNEVGVEELVRAVFNDILSEQRIAEYSITRIASESYLLQYGTVFMVMLGVMISGLVAAFNIIFDKESNAINALAISPLGFWQYIIARALFMMILSFFLTMATVFIMLGGQVNYLALAIAFVCAYPLACVMGFLVGGYASNQIQAGAILKIISFVFLSFPALSIFLPSQWQPFFYWLPHYWVFKSLEVILVGKPGPMPLAGIYGAALAGSLIMLAVVMPLVKKKLAILH